MFLTAWFRRSARAVYKSGRITSVNEKSFFTWVLVTVLASWSFSVKAQDTNVLFQQYQEIAREMIEQGSISVPVSEDEYLVLFSCHDLTGGLSNNFTSLESWEYLYLGESSSAHMSGEVRQWALRQHAFLFELLRYQLTSAGYSQSFANQAIDRLREQLMPLLLQVNWESIDPNNNPFPDGLSLEFSSALDAFQDEVRHYAALHPELPQPYRSYACGSTVGGLLAELRIRPPEGRVWVISEFDYRLCELNGIDPRDLQECSWREETGNRFLVVSGNYRMYVEWEDGRTVFTTRNIHNSWLEATGRGPESGFGSGHLLTDLLHGDAQPDVIIELRP